MIKRVGTALLTTFFLFILCCSGARRQENNYSDTDADVDSDIGANTDTDADVDTISDGDPEEINPDALPPGSLCACDRDCQPAEGQEGLCLVGMCVIVPASGAGNRRATCPERWTVTSAAGSTICACSPPCSLGSCYGRCSTNTMCIAGEKGWNMCDPECASYCFPEDLSTRSDNIPNDFSGDCREVTGFGCSVYAECSRGLLWADFRSTLRDADYYCSTECPRGCRSEGWLDWSYGLTGPELVDMACLP